MINKIFLILGIVAALVMVACDDSGDDGNHTPPHPETSVWVADQPDKEVVIVDGEGNFVRTVGESGTFSKPNAFEVKEDNGEVWVCDYYTNRIRRCDADGNIIASTPPMSSHVVLRATGISLNATTGECWVSDRGNNRVVRLKPDMSVVAVVTGLSYPRSVSVTADRGDVWVADEGNDAVVRVIGSIQGEVTIGSAEAARYDGLAKPWVVKSEATGGAWAASQEDGKVVRLSPTGQELASVGGFEKPTDIAVHNDAGYVVVADAGLGALVALPCSLTGSHAGYDAVAIFTSEAAADPEDVFVEPATGDIYVADMSADAIIVLDTTGKEVSRLKGFSGPAAVAVWKKTGGER